MKATKYLRDMEHPTVLGYELDRRTLLPIKKALPAPADNGDYGFDPVGDGRVKMHPSGEIVTYATAMKRLNR